VPEGLYGGIKLKIKTKTTYVCEICGEEYSEIDTALKCESRGAKTPKYAIGDIVTILSGEGSGKSAKITGVFYYSPSWAGERYAHHVGYNADLIDHGGSRQLIEGESV